MQWQISKHVSKLSMSETNKFGNTATLNCHSRGKVSQCASQLVSVVENLICCIQIGGYVCLTKKKCNLKLQQEQSSTSAVTRIANRFFRVPLASIPLFSAFLVSHRQMSPSARYVLFLFLFSTILSLTIIASSIRREQSHDSKENSEIEKKKYVK